MLAGRALALGGHRTEALDELTSAEAELLPCGAEGYRGEAVRELRRFGQRVAPRRRASATTGVEALTARELEVAELVAANKATREIADALFVSEKTVETHLAHIFAKLGVSSRKAGLSQGRTRSPSPSSDHTSSEAVGSAPSWWRGIGRTGCSSSSWLVGPGAGVACQWLGHAGFPSVQ